MKEKTIVSIIISLSVILPFVLVDAGPIAAGSAVSVCYTACNAGWCACMTGSGLVAGTTGPVGWYAWLTSAAAGCSVVQGACMAACTGGGLALAAAPTP